MRFAQLILLLNFLFSLLSCINPREARERGVVATYTSNKTAKEVAVCVATSWESDYFFANQVNMRPTNTGYTLQVQNGLGSTFVVLDVDETNTGSISKYYKGIVFGEEKWDKSVVSCQ